MKARALIPTIGTSLALIAPAAHAAAGSGNIVGCAARTTKAADAEITRSTVPGYGARALQLVQLGDGASRMPAARTTCSVGKTGALVAPNRFQVLRDAL
jgi:hypothetical protein